MDPYLLKTLQNYYHVYIFKLKLVKNLDVAT